MHTRSYGTAFASPLCQRLNPTPSPLAIRYVAREALPGARSTAGGRVHTEPSAARGIVSSKRKGGGLAKHKHPPPPPPQPRPVSQVGAAERTTAPHAISALAQHASNAPAQRASTPAQRASSMPPSSQLAVTDHAAELVVVNTAVAVRVHLLDNVLHLLLLDAKI
eukprot:365370-Chlamydomonas_euryale.AAC.14